MRTPAPRRTRSRRRTIATGRPVDGGTVLTGVACVLAAVLLYAMAALFWGVTDDDGLDLDDRPTIGAKLRR